MKKIWEWLVKSSADPAKLAMTVKGFLGTLSSVILLFTPFLGLNITEGQLADGSEMVVQIVVAVAGIISSIVMILGFIRKLVITFKPQ